MARVLGRRFYEQEAAEVARELIGKVLVRRRGGAELRGRIVEVEAYVGEHDLACHAAKGRTGRTEVMYGPGGHAYVYLIYGVHQMLNIVTGKAGCAQAVLIRAAAGLNGWGENVSGPGRLARGFGIGRGMNGVDMTKKEEGLWVEEGTAARVGVCTRIGVAYAGAWAHELLRFYEVGNRAVSKPWPAAMRIGKRG